MEFLTQTLLNGEERNSGSLFAFKSVSVIKCLEMVTTPKGTEMLTSEKEVGEAQTAHCSAAHCTVQLTVLRRYCRVHHRGRCTAKCSLV